MHTTQYTDKIGTDWTIIHNGDWSGDVEITGIIPPVEFHQDGRTSLELPSDLLVFCVGEMVRQFRMQRVEELTSRQLVTLPDD